MVVHKSNLLAALHIAMKKQREDEKKLGYTGDSGFVAGLQEVYNEIEAGDHTIHLKED